ncbi:MAG TPA: MFS transporter [Pseudonocardiaceae bacterium]|nr:MFS transporter [Pseudonocardiaceae bacterium]
MTTTAQSPTRAPAADSAAAGRRGWLMLTVLLAAQFMALLDVTIVNVAMPTMGTDLHASGAALQLIVSGYTVSYAMLLITGARLGDLFGRRRMFTIGVVGFTVASLLCGLAPSAGPLIAARFVQGAAAALTMPQIISVIQIRFAGNARTTALSAYSAVIAVGGIVGQVVGGVLVTANLFGASWRPIFLVNVPIGIVVVALAPVLVPADPARGARKLDLVGLAFAVPAVFLVVLPLVLGHQEGWPAWTFGCLAAGLLLGAAFIAVERRVAARGGDPLLNLAVLRVPGMAFGMVALVLTMIAYGGFLFSFALHLQAGLGDSALRAGLMFAPAAAMFGLCGFYWRKLPAAIHHWLIPGGLLIAAAAFVGVGLSLRTGTNGGVWLYVVLVAFGLAMGPAFGSLMAHSLVRVPVAEAADASGLLTTTIQLGQAIGVAAFGGLFLTLAGRPTAQSSAHAFSTTIGWQALLLVIGAAAGLLLARTARAVVLSAR